MPSRTNTSPASGLLRILLLVLVSGVALFLLHHFSAIEFLRSGGAAAHLRALGAFGPIAFILVMGILMTLWVPGTLIVLIGAAVFPPNTALLLNYFGCLAAALLGFGTARLIGGSALQTLIDARAPGLRSYQRRLASDGFMTVFYLRLIPTPFNAISYLAGLSPIPPVTYLAATSLAILPGSFAFTTLLTVGIEAVHTGSLTPLLAPRPIVGLILYAAALLLPPKIKARYFPTLPDPGPGGGMS